MPKIWRSEHSVELDHLCLGFPILLRSELEISKSLYVQFKRVRASQHSKVKRADPLPPVFTAHTERVTRLVVIGSRSEILISSESMRQRSDDDDEAVPKDHSIITPRVKSYI